MRVVIAHAFYRQSGGEDNVVRQQVEVLRDRHEVLLFGKSNRDLVAGPSVAARMLYSPRLESEVAKALRAFRPDVIHLHNAYPALGPAVFLAAGRLGLPVVMTVHNYRLRCPNGYMFTADTRCTRCERGHYYNAILHPCFPTKQQGLAYASTLWIHRYLLHLEKRISQFVCPSEFMRTTLADWGIPVGKLNLVRNFPRPVLDPDSSPGVYGVFVGRLSREKGVHILLQALRKAGDPPFTILGDGPEADGLRQSVSQLELANTTFAGRVPFGEVDTLLRRARYVVLPSLWNENAPLAALEAMSRGRPLIVSSVGGLPELVAAGQGAEFRPGDSDELARVIRGFVRDDEVCRAAGTASLAFAQDELTPARHLAGLESVYRRVVM